MIGVELAGRRRIVVKRARCFVLAGQRNSGELPQRRNIGFKLAYVARRIVTFELFDGGFGQVYRRQPIGEIILIGARRLRRQVGYR